MPGPAAPSGVQVPDGFGSAGRLAEGVPLPDATLKYLAVLCPVMDPEFNRVDALCSVSVVASMLTWLGGSLSSKAFESCFLR